MRNSLRLKFLVDWVLSFLAIALLAVPMILIAWMVYFRLGSPIIFRQTRPGLRGEPFQMFKFRTMKNSCDAKGKLLPDDARLTNFGRFLRSTSLDELPELWNVLKGEMSLVGPRPLLMDYLPLYSPEQARRHEVKPGITGWAQVNGRNAISWEDKFQLDAWYVENQSFKLDCKILWMTLSRVWSRDGINTVSETTMPAFEGNKNENQSFS